MTSTSKKSSLASTAATIAGPAPTSGASSTVITISRTPAPPGIKERKPATMAKLIVAIAVTQPVQPAATALAPGVASTKHQNELPIKNQTSDISSQPCSI